MGHPCICRYQLRMTNPIRPNPGKEMVTVYGKVPRQWAERLDELAGERRWSRAQLVSYCIEQFIENADPSESHREK